jgi:hypothetical protein
MARAKAGDRPVSGREKSKAEEIVEGIGSLAILSLLGWCGYQVYTAEPDPNRDRDAEAFVMCQEPVRARLLSPASADFPFLDHETVRLGDGHRYRVRSYVDSQNRYGAMLRTHFTCVIEYRGGGDWPDPVNWKVIELDLQPG